MAEPYQVEFLPSAQEDMVEIVRYISQELLNPIAAEDLAEDFVKTADSLSAFPYAHEAYIPIRPLKHEYRKVSVKNYLMFFWVEEEKKIVTVARVIYAARDYGKLLK